MSDREFPESVQYQAVISNLEKNKGQLKCCNCGKIIVKKSECHFDHIHAYSKGGKSILSNCQILCADCNERKNAKALEDFLLEEKARKFLSGESISNEDFTENENQIDDNSSPNTDAETAIKNFIIKNGDIRKVDFTRPRNNLPSISYVRQYYGTLSALKREFGLEDKVIDWNRDSIMCALRDFIAKTGKIQQKDLISANHLPSLPCILSNYPEYKNLSDLQIGLGLSTTRVQWTKELAIERGKKFIEQAGKIGLYDLRLSNGLPSNNVVVRLFGSLAVYQEAIGAPITKANEFISKEDISIHVNDYFRGNERIVESRKEFFRTFTVAESTILKRYETFDLFCQEFEIKVKNIKKFRYSKEEVDQLILDYLKQGNDIPKNGTELVNLGLPSRDVITKFYDDWKEPFYLYKKLHEKFNQ